MNNYFISNQKLWNNNVPHHAKSDFYQMEAFKKGANTLKAIELDALGDVSGKRILHLQCHFGQDSLSFARMGAKVTGVDFSEKAIQLARELNQELNLDANFVYSNVLELPQNLEGQFDIVFTSYGVICWLDNLNKWAEVINHFLVPGGTFYIAEFHPMLMMFNFDEHKMKYDYFNQGNPYLEIAEGSYANDDTSVKNDEYTWSHSIHEIMTPLIQQGLIVEDFQEFPYSPYDCFADMKKVGEDQFVYNFPVAIPHIFSLKMKKS